MFWFGFVFGFVFCVILGIEHRAFSLNYIPRHLFFFRQGLAKLLCNPPVSASQSPGIISVHHCTQGNK